MTVHRLAAIDGRLYFPTGCVYLDPQGGEAPSLLMRVYDAGDCDTCPWPMVSSSATQEELRTRLACALYDERETNDTFSYGDTVELPDGTPFDFDSIVP